MPKPEPEPEPIEDAPTYIEEKGRKVKLTQAQRDAFTEAMRKKRPARASVSAERAEEDAN